MSWDIILLDIPAEVQSVADLPKDWESKSLGDRGKLIARIQQVCPDADFTDPSWGMLMEPEFVIEFGMGQEEICDSVMLHTRGGGAAMEMVKQLTEGLHLRGIDVQTGEFFSIEAAEASFREWQAFRDRAVGQHGAMEGAAGDA